MTDQHAPSLQSMALSEAKDWMQRAKALLEDSLANQEAGNQGTARYLADRALQALSVAIESVE